MTHYPKQPIRENPYVSAIRHQFNIGDKVRIDKNVVGVTIIDRGKVYTIEQFYDKKPCVIFRLRFDDEYCLSFEEMPGRWFTLDYWILVEQAQGQLPEELFTL